MNQYYITIFLLESSNLTHQPINATFLLRIVVFFRRICSALIDCTPNWSLACSVFWWPGFLQAFCWQYNVNAYLPTMTCLWNVLFYHRFTYFLSMVRIFGFIVNEIVLESFTILIWMIMELSSWKIVSIYESNM